MICQVFVTGLDGQNGNALGVCSMKRDGDLAVRCAVKKFDLHVRQGVAEVENLNRQAIGQIVRERVCQRHNLCREPQFAVRARAVADCNQCFGMACVCLYEKIARQTPGIVHRADISEILVFGKTKKPVPFIVVGQARRLGLMRDDGQPLRQILHEQCRQIAQTPFDRPGLVTQSDIKPRETARYERVGRSFEFLTDTQVTGNGLAWRNCIGQCVDPEFMCMGLAHDGKAGNGRGKQKAHFFEILMILLRSLVRTIMLSMALALGGTAAAHEIRPAIADVEVTEERVELSVRVALESLVAGINLDGLDDTNDAPEAAIYDLYRAMEPADFEAALREAWPRIAQGFVIETGGERVFPEIVSVAIPAVGDVELPRDSILTLTTALPEGDDPVVLGWQASYGILVLRQVGGDEASYEAYLTSGDLSEPLPRAEIVDESRVTVFLRYIVVGFDHIVPLGADHILFVLGLFFFSTQFRPLLWQVTAFTVAHTITLALAATGVVSIPAEIVEPLIAATIVYVGVENVLNFGNTRARTALVFAFGLLHGLGFASVLGDFGIASGRFVEALIGFNIGVEFGQLAVIAIAFLLVGAWFSKKTWYRAAIAIPVSVIISLIGMYWVIERTGIAPLPPLPI